MRKLRMSELNRMSTEDFKKADKFPLIAVLDNVRSTLNVGSVFRTADAFRMEKVVLCGLTPTPENREMRKTALGGSESMAWEHKKETAEAVKELKSNGYKIVAIEQTSQSKMLNELHIDPKPVALIFGNEVTGVSQEVLELCDLAVEIPQFGTKHSLNISVSAGIAIWEFIKILHRSV